MEIWLDIFEGQEKLGGMKKRVNGIPQILAPCPWSRFGTSTEKEKWRYNVLHVVIFSILIVSLIDVLSRTHVNRKCVFLHPWAVFCRAVWCPNFRGKRSIKTIILVIETWVSWHIKQDKGLSSCWRASNAFAWAPYLKKKEEIMLCQNLTERKCTVGTMSQCTAMVRKDVRNFASAVKQCWSRDIN